MSFTPVLLSGSVGSSGWFLARLVSVVGRVLMGLQRFGVQEIPVAEHCGDVRPNVVTTRFSAEK